MINERKEDNYNISQPMMLPNTKYSVHGLVCSKCTMCNCVCVCACVRACVRVRVRFGCIHMRECARVCLGVISYAGLRCTHAEAVKLM